MNVAFGLFLFIMAMLVFGIVRPMHATRRVSPFDDRLGAPGLQPPSGVTRCAAFWSDVTINWPFGRLIMSDGVLEVQIPRNPFGFMMPSSLRTPDGAMRLKLDEMTSIARAGWFVQWGIEVELEDGVLGLWSPGLPRLLSTYAGATIIRRKRRFFWRLHHYVRR